MRPPGLKLLLVFASAAALLPPEAGASREVMPGRPLGRTGFRTAVFALGGQSALETPGLEDKAYEIINTAIDLGVNYLDTAPLYGNGVSEANIGIVMKDRREKVFLATKSHFFCYEGSMALIEESMERLQTSFIDLYQHHGVHSESDLNRITAEDGALRAFMELRKRGVIGHIGITSHSPLILLKALQLGVYDCMLVTLNPAGEVMEDREHFEEFMKRAQEENVGVLAMKILNRGALLKDGVGMRDLLGYALSHPVAAAVIGISEPWQVYDNVDNAGNFRRMPTADKIELERRFGAEMPRQPGNTENRYPPGGCFVASAAYGCSRTEALLALGRIRDCYLLNNRAGTALVAAYAVLGPPAAEIIDSHSALKKIARLHLAPAAIAARGIEAVSSVLQSMPARSRAVSR